MCSLKGLLPLNTFLYNSHVELSSMNKADVQDYALSPNQVFIFVHGKPHLEENLYKFCLSDAFIIQIERTQ